MTENIEELENEFKSYLNDSTSDISYRTISGLKEQLKQKRNEKLKRVNFLKKIKEITEKLIEQEKAENNIYTSIIDCTEYVKYEKENEPTNYPGCKKTQLEYNIDLIKFDARFKNK